MITILDDYLTYLEYQKNYSKQTIDAYKRDIEKFLIYMNEQQYTLQSVDSFLILNFLSNEITNNISRRSNARRIIALRRFFNYLIKNQIVDRNPFVFVSNSKYDKKLPEFFYIEEITRLFNENKKRTDFLALRDQAIIEILFSTGIRVSELVNLTLQNVNIKERVLRIIGKGNKERQVPFSKSTQKTLIDYLDTTRKEILNKNGKLDGSSYVFLNDRGEQLTSRGVEYILKCIEKKVNTSLSLYPHKFRHTFATYLLNQGLDLRLIQELMGHSSIGTTQVYTHISNDKMQEEYIKAFPRRK